MSRSKSNTRKTVRAAATKPAASLTSGKKVQRGKASKAAPAKKAATKKAEGGTRERISAHLPKLQSLIKGKPHTVDELRDTLGICRKSVRKLLGQANAKAGETAGTFTL